MKTLSEDKNVNENSFLNAEEKQSHLDMNFFEENALIVTFLYESTTPYYYACENITIEDDSIIVTLKVSGDGTGDAEQNTLLFGNL